MDLEFRFPPRVDSVLTSMTISEIFLDRCVDALDFLDRLLRKSCGMGTLLLWLLLLLCNDNRFAFKSLSLLLCMEMTSDSATDTESSAVI